MCKKSVWLFQLVCLSLLFILESSSYASQNSKVIRDSTEVHEHPDENSIIVAKLPFGVDVRSSSKSVQDKKGKLWYKVRAPSGGVGYVHSDALETSEIRRDLASSGIQATFAQDEVPSKSWVFLIRAMGLGGLNTTANKPGVSITGSNAEFGGEAEATFCLPLAERGYFHRMFSVGAAYFYFTDRAPVIAGSVVARIYSPSRIEPEIRLRIGKSRDIDGVQGALSVAAAYPISNYSGFHISSFLEFTAMDAFSTKTIYMWGALGLGIHF